MSDGRDRLLRRMKSVAERNAAALAVKEKSRQMTYGEFARWVSACRASLCRDNRLSKAPVGILLDRSAAAYAAMWASIAEGRAYVPLNPRYPASRLQTIVDAAGVDCILCSSALQETAQKLGLANERIHVLQGHENGGTDSTAPWEPRTSTGDIAYILYTSGSTGKPKGVPISYGNLAAFIDNMMATIPYPPGSICSQVCELSFDFSVHEIYQALLSGATLCPAQQIDLFNPGRFISENKISVWISVPSLARVVLTNQARSRSVLDSIRLSIFNGEALTASLARDWQRAIPDADIYNTYGPTECTVAVTAQKWIDDDDLSEIGIVSIGKPLPGCAIALLSDENLIHSGCTEKEQTGELLLNTPQRFNGYADPALAQPFISDASGSVFYKTGDKVLSRDGLLFHLGRLDHQVKIGGHRIELMEIEHQLRRVLNTDALAVLAYPRQLPTELVLFVAAKGEVPALTAEALGLPGYMVPKRVKSLATLPVTPHGKLDRLALQSILEDERS